MKQDETTVKYLLKYFMTSPLFEVTRRLRRVTSNYGQVMKYFNKYLNRSFVLLLYTTLQYKTYNLTLFVLFRSSCVSLFIDKNSSDLCFILCVCNTMTYVTSFELTRGATSKAKPVNIVSSISHCEILYTILHSWILRKIIGKISLVVYNYFFNMLQRFSIGPRNDLTQAGIKSISWSNAYQDSEANERHLVWMVW